MRAVVCGLLAVLALAGCAENGLSTDDSDPEIHGADSETHGEDDATPAPHNEAANALPFRLDVGLTNATVSLGQPFQVNISADLEDGANATWAAWLEMGNATGNGTDTIAATQGVGLPAEFNLTAERAGNLTLVVTASSPGHENASVSLAVTVADEVAAPALPDPVVITGSSQVGHPAHIVQCFRDGIDGDFHAVAPAQEGWQYRLTSGYVVYWWNGGSYVSGGGGSVNGSHAEICDESGAGGSYTLTMWHPDAAEP